MQTWLEPGREPTFQVKIRKIQRNQRIIYRNPTCSQHARSQDERGDSRRKGLWSSQMSSHLGTTEIGEKEEFEKSGKWSYKVPLSMSDLTKKEGTLRRNTFVLISHLKIITKSAYHPT